jgi:hypothetical protein
MSGMWWYTLAVLVIRVINSELRRLCDWKFGFSQVEILAVLPPVCLIPGIYSLTLYSHQERRLGACGVT